MGPALCLLSAAGFGAMAIFGTFAYEAGVSPSTLLLVRFTLAAILLALLLVVRPSSRRLQLAPEAMDPGRGASGGPRPMTRGLIATALALGAVGYATQASLYFQALTLMDASLLSLLLYTFPVLVTVGAVLLGRTTLTPGRCAALLAASGGTLLVLMGAAGLTFSALGIVMAFGSALTYTAYILVSDTVVHRMAPAVLSALVMSGAAVSLAGRAAVIGDLDLSFEAIGWLWVACIAVVSTVVAMLAFFAGLRRTGASTAAILSTFEPVVTTTLAALTLRESLSPVQIVGAVLVLSSAAVLQLERGKRDPAEGTSPTGAPPGAADPAATPIPGHQTRSVTRARPATASTGAHRRAHRSWGRV